MERYKAFPMRCVSRQRKVPAWKTVVHCGRFLLRSLRMLSWIFELQLEKSNNQKLLCLYWKWEEYIFKPEIFSVELNHMGDMTAALGYDIVPTVVLKSVGKIWM
ncbi:hypothetical protein CEXT_563541 [Caerostris extrusa]|uniref:Uncharacterized protein n=1 Tax=Caerostris extrusa TaxID=172846 RepID=A0AAV4Y155_CAEEX|nr:hypothetical protein CEXT_563541 [Caerostris extrusa]